MFLAEIEAGASVAIAAQAVDMSRESAYRLRRNPRAADFAARWAAIDAARPKLIDFLEDPARAEESAERADRVLADRAERPGFDRWLIRRMTALDDRSPKRDLL